jgi:hypothetical protein
MRRALMAVVAVSLAVIIGGCGSSSSSTVSNPLATELSYFPAQPAFVAAIATDPHGAAVQNVGALLGAFPLAKLGIDALKSTLSSMGLDYQGEIEPLFGNPIAVGALNPSSPSTSFLAVWITKSAAKLAALVKRLPGSKADGSVGGATLYRSGSLTVALEGATAVAGPSAEQVGAALSRHAHGGGMSSAAFSTGTRNLPRDALVRAFGTPTGAFAGAQTGSARAVPWLAALRGFAASLSAGSTGLTAQFRLDTSGRSLTTSQLPFAAGTAPPQLAGKLPIAVGVRDPAQTIAFIEAVARAVDPAASKSKASHDLKALAALLTGDLIVQSDTRITMGRANVTDPALAARQLAKLPGAVRQPGGFYAIKTGHGTSLRLGLVGNALVAGVATPAALRAFATAPATPVPNAQGSVAFRISLEELVRLALGSAPGTLIQSVLSTLGDVTGSAAAAPAGVTGALGLRVK